MQEKKDSILLFGYGKYGEKIAKSLISNNYQVIVIDKEDSLVQKAIKNGYKAYCIDIMDDEEIVQILASYGFEHIFCAMDSDDENIYISITMKSIDESLDIISLCESKDSEKKLELAGVRGVLNTLDATAQNIYHLLKSPVMIEAMEEILYYNQEIDFVEIEVPKGSFLDGKYVYEIEFKKRFNLILMGLIDTELDDKFIFVTKGINHKIDEGDILLLIGKDRDLKVFEETLAKSTME